MFCPRLNRPFALGLTLLLGLLALVVARANSPAPPTPAPDAALVRLGWQLMAARQLAFDAQLACLDCHDPARGWTDGVAVATADGLNTPTLWGLAERTTFSWFTPEVESLEAFIMLPLSNPREMGPLSDTTLQRVAADPLLADAYADAFPHTAAPVTWEHTALALAAAIRTIPNPELPPLTPLAQHGTAIFAEIGCAGCHHGPTLSTEAYVMTGVGDQPARVPSLIGLAQTAPYFHDGSAATLTDVVRFYQAGGHGPDPQRTRAIHPILLTEDEVLALVAFLASQ
jgi:cytochrome c peroxidase